MSKKKLKTRKSLIVNIIIIFLALNIVSLFLFSRYAVSRTQQENLENSKARILEMVKEKGICVADVFDKVESNTELLGIIVENELMNEQSSELSEEYLILSDGTLTRLKDSSKSDNEQSNVICPDIKTMSKELIREINITECMDKSFCKIVENEVVIWAYIVTKGNVLRCSPYTNLTDYYSGAHVQLADVFYEIADEKHNPERKVVWTDIYYDYLGEGWVKTCSRPVYDGKGELFGVVSIDVSVSAIHKSFFEDFMTEETGTLCWADKDGNIIYHSDHADVKAEQGKGLDMNVFDEKMTESKENAMKKIFSGECGIAFFYDNSSKMLVYTAIDEIDSVIYLEIDMEEFKSKELIDKKGVWYIVVIDLVIAVICAAILYVYISQPLKKLVRQAEHIAEGNFKIVENDIDGNSAFYEISSLNKAFLTMKRNLEVYTDNLVARNRELSIIMDSIDETLMISDLGGNIELKAKDKSTLPKDVIKKGIDEVLKTKETYEEQIVFGGEVYKNTYYPVFKDMMISSVVISNACITKNVLIEKELLQIEKMAGVGQLAAAIVHELKNSLALINGATYILEITSENDRKEVKSIKSAVMEAENIIDTLLDYSQKDEAGIEPIHIKTVFNQILLLAKKEIIYKGISVELDVADDCYINSSGRAALKVILQNIILNAIQQFTEGGLIKIEAIETENEVALIISDTAGGIALSDKESIFEPFITTKEDGHGIGLWITKQLVNSLKGTISVYEPKKGMTAFTINLPKNESEN